MTTCDLVRPDPKALFDRHQSMMSAYVLGGAPVAPQSLEFYVAALNYQINEQFWSLADMMWRERDPRYACCENLVAMAAVDGVYPEPATYAEGYVTLTGTPGAVLAPNIIIQFGAGTYVTSAPATVPAVMPPNGAVTLRFKAQTPGVAVPPPSPTTVGRLVTPLAGVTQEVTVHGGGFCGGKPAEQCEPFRERYLDRLRFAPNQTWRLLEEAVAKWPCATRVCARRDCCDRPDACDCPDTTILAHVLFDGTFPGGIAPASVADEMTAWLWGTPQGRGLGQMPIGSRGRIVPVTAVPYTVQFSGLSCATAAQKAEIQRRVEGMSLGLCPSEELCAVRFIALAAQIVPNACDIGVMLNTSVETATITKCGDLDPGCDAMPVLQSVSIA